MAPALNGFFKASKSVGLVSMEDKSKVMRSGLKRLLGIYLAFAAASICMAFICYFFVDFLHQQIDGGEDLNIHR